MFRMIALVELAEGADMDALIAAGRKMIATDPEIRAGEIYPGRKLMADYVPHASFSVLLDFDDEEGWRRYVAGPHHVEYDALAMPFTTRVTATQYERVE